MDNLTKEFLSESIEGLDRMDRCLTELELRPNDKDLLGEIFRAMHTIKGTTGFLGFSRLEKLAHSGETLLGSLRDGRLTADTALVGGLLQLMDGVRAILRLIETTGEEGSRSGDQDEGLIALMHELNHGDKRDATPAHHELPGDEDHAPDSTTAGVSPPGVSEKTLRIDVDVLNRMMNLVGDLVLTRNQILQSNGESESFPELARRLDSVTSDLRETVMQARMQPVGYLFDKFPRIVRDLALSCGKNVRIEFAGQATGLDKSLLEAIKDPLTHAVRNAIDHGIEDPRTRALAGKPRKGAVSLRAYHHNGTVVIEVEDDGGGISTRNVVAKAVERGLISEEQAAAMTDREKLQLIFRPGLSTAATVTRLSGRGVGMDVVLSNVEKVGGTVEIESHEGKGTLLRMRMPLTLAIMRALVVRSGGQSFCVPQSSLVELVHVPWRGIAAAVEWMGGAELFRLRESLLPMVRLDRFLQLDEKPEHRQPHGFYLVVLETEDCQYGLVVDDLMTPEEVVVKPLSPVLRQIGVFCGATVLGTGSLAMILDVGAMGARAGIRASAEAVAVPSLPGPVAVTANPSFLIFEDERSGQRNNRMALPLSMVVRIESVAMSDVEYAGDRALLQYRGDLLPLEDRGGVLQELSGGDGEKTATVLICQRPGRGPQEARQRMGVVVRRVIEVAAGNLMENTAELSTERLAMVHERLTVVRDAFAPSATLKEVA